jgi:hypothetical protein
MCRYRSKSQCTDAKARQFRHNRFDPFIPKARVFIRPAEGPGVHHRGSPARDPSLRLKNAFARDDASSQSRALINWIRTVRECASVVPL